jgi:hypothetical protein
MVAPDVQGVCRPDGCLHTQQLATTYILNLQHSRAAVLRLK